MRSVALLICTALMPFQLHGQHHAPAAEVDLRWGVRIPMRDGVELNATLYLPHDQRGPLPVILSMTPYIADRFHPLAKYFAGHGYVAALVDVRGRGSSGGSITPFIQEGKDSYDTVEWLAKQPWSNGKVAMSGGSYGGFNQWYAAKMFPPHLAAILPVAAAHAGVDFPFLGGVGSLYLIQWITFTSGKTPNASLFGDASWWASKWRTVYTQHLPYASADSVVGNPSPAFQSWITHPFRDDWSEQTAPSPDDYRRLTLSIFTRTGMYDGDQIGAMDFYRDHMRYGNPEARAKHYLVIGPWDHAGTRIPQREFGGLKFGEAMMLDMPKLDTEWYDWVLKAGPRPEIMRKRVAYYVTGAEAWKYADSLEAIAPQPAVYYLTSPGAGATDVFHSGLLATSQPAPSPPDRWTYEPLDTRPGSAESDDGGDLLDQTAALELFGRGLVYHTAPFERDTEISGFPRASLWLALDVPDTDFQLLLYEITPDGKSIQLDETQLRARYRESLRIPKPVPSGTALEYSFGQFRFMSRRIAAGSRLRLVVESPNSIQLQKNYNSGGDVARETAKDAHTAHVRLYHEAGRWSTLELPVVR